MDLRSHALVALYVTSTLALPGCGADAPSDGGSDAAVALDSNADVDAAADGSVTD